MKRRQWLCFPLLGFLGLLLWLVLAGKGGRIPIHELPDGSTVKLCLVSTGKNLEAFWGKPWQRVVFKWCGTNFPILRPLLIGGVVEKITGSVEAGSFGLSFAHCLFDASHGFHTNKVSVLNDDGSEICAVQRREHIIYAPEQKAADKVLMIALTFWEVPRTKGRTLRVRFYPSSKGTNFVEFPIRNPS